MGLIILPDGMEPDETPEPQATFTREAMQRWASMMRSILRVRLWDHTLPSELHVSLEHYVEDGDPRITIGILMLLAAAGSPGDFPDVLTELLNDMAWSMEAAGLAVRACRFCGCSNHEPCPGGCWWIDWDVCSACEGKVAAE